MSEISMSEIKVSDSIVLSQGATGLVYLTHQSNPGIFLAAHDEDSARLLVEPAAAALLDPACVEIVHHTVNDHESGFRITVPDPEWMTPEQMEETFGRLVDHMRARLLS